MRDRLLRFVGNLRDRGVGISVAESLDAARAVGVVGVEREPLREALAACLVKDEVDRPLFDNVFDEDFPLVARTGRGRRGHHGDRGGGGEGATRSIGSGVGEASGMPGARATVDRRDGCTRARGEPDPSCVSAGRAASRRRQVDHENAERKESRDMRRHAQHARRKADREDGEREGLPLGHGLRQRELVRKPFREYTPSDVEGSEEVVRILARELRGRLARRLRVSPRGRLDFRRTLRRAASTGGTPMHLLFRGPRPGRPGLVALCDVSGSVAAVSTYLLGLIAPATRFFRWVETFVYVDHLCPASFEDGRLVPHTRLDLYAASDFGQVLAEYCAGPVSRLDRNSVFLVLGDARNNRRPPRVRLLADIRARSRAVYWLNPETAARWNTGDSVIAQYQRHCTAVVECGNLGVLVETLGRIL